MTDRELLELAAKAAGMDIEWQPCGWAHDNNTGCEWNPLTADGDALRLAVKCGFIVDTNGMNTRVGFPFVSYAAIESHGTEPLAATRRAIVRAAAEIGRSKE